MSPPRALFLDRDGVINEEVSYLIRSEDVRFVPGIVSLCRTARTLGYHIVVVTNQTGIGRGFYTEAQFHVLMDWMQSELAREGVHFDRVYFSPWHPEHAHGIYKREHEDRKPGTGMLRRAEAEFGVSLTDSVLIGDRCSDIAAANSARLRRAFLIVGTETAPCPGDYQTIHLLAEAERWLIETG